jgi:hypothetical protein
MLKEKGRLDMAKGHVLFWVPEWVYSQLMIIILAGDGEPVPQPERAGRQPAGQE